ncbi:NKL protein, partial [Asarcornis scutulata]|nr:NKL protein [Asarcornis scutulata]
DAAPPGKGKKCSICTKVLQQLKKMVGDDPDEDTVNAALRKVCGAMKGLGRLCKAMVKKFGPQIAEALQNDDDPQDVCTSLKFCKG